MEQAELIKSICMHIRPEAYFNKDEGAEKSTTFMDDIEQSLGRKLTLEEKVALGDSSTVYTDSVEEEDYDTIERI